jgi:hypothetical protein
VAYIAPLLALAPFGIAYAAARLGKREAFGPALYASFAGEGVAVLALLAR